jgi:hypothetical protein
MEDVQKLKFTHPHHFPEQMFPLESKESHRPLAAAAAQEWNYYPE